VLDYTHRRADGSVGAIPDSIKKEFKTRHGRKVYDGGGIDPDVTVVQDADIPVLRALDEQGFIFDYATGYALKHASIPPAREFRLSDEEFQSFVSWALSRNFRYESTLEIELKGLRKAAEGAKSNSALLSRLAELEKLVASGHTAELKSLKGRITSMLEAEIALRYYKERGYIEVGFVNDRDIQRATSLLRNTAEYNTLLNLN
jgi:carboxyl-terminal processing protease